VIARIGHDQRDRPPPASLGVAEVRPADRSAEEALRRADEALYRAKRLGRDRVEVA